MYLQNSTRTNSLSVTADLKFDFVKTSTPSSVFMSSANAGAVIAIIAQIIVIIII